MAITLHGSVAEIIEEQVSVGGYESPEDLVYEAIESLVKQKINAGIKEGLDDLNAGRYMELTSSNIDEILSKPISQW